MKRLWLLVVLLTSSQCCSEKSFNNIQIKASTASILEKTFLLPVTTLDGCLSPSTGLEEATRIDVINQAVPILFEDAVSDLSNLEILNLEGNGITAVKKGAFKNIPLIRILNVARNKISEIHNGVFTNLNASRLYLRNNEINLIESGAFDSMPNLKTIDLNNNKITTWDSNWFKNSPNVYHLSFEYNLLEKIPAVAFKNIKAKHTFLTYEQTTSVFLGHNKITVIDARAFEGLSELDYLNLDDNLIDAVDDNLFKPLTNVNTLVLSKNKLTCVTQEFLSNLPSGDMVSLEDNPWDCDCLKKMRSWLKQKNIQVKLTISHIECTLQRIRKVLEESRSLDVTTKKA